MDEYNIIKHIGKGSFSNVFLCKKINKASLSILSFTGIYNDYDDSIDEFIIKEVNIENLVRKYVKQSARIPRKIAKHIADIKSVTITPYNNELALKMQQLNDEEEYYSKKLTDLIDSEIEVLKQLDNENIIKFFSSSIKDQIYCIKMEYCEYGDLYHILKNNSKSNDFALRNYYDGFDNKFVMKYLMDTIKGLKYLHDINIIHRDIKLHNILVKRENNEFVFKLSDFGFSCVDLESNLNECLNMNDFEFDKNGLKKKYYKLCGTPYYMAPEIILNIDEFEDMTSNRIIEELVLKFYDKKVDLWSYGICLYELIFNNLPFTNIYDIHDLKEFFSKSTTQSDIYKMIDEKTIINDRVKKLLKDLLTINPSFRISTDEVFNYIESDYNVNINENINENISDKEMLKNLVKSSDMKESEIKVELNNEIVENSWIIDDKSYIVNSWDKINKASSFIMKISVDNNFMKWLLHKK